MSIYSQLAPFLQVSLLVLMYPLFLGFLILPGQLYAIVAIQATSLWHLVSSSILLSSCPDKNVIAISAVALFVFCFADEDAVGLVTSSGSDWGCCAGRTIGLFSVQ